MAIPVAVVLSPGGNHADETADGAENMTIPAIPFRIAQIWLNLDIIENIMSYFKYCPSGKITLIISSKYQFYWGWTLTM